MSQRPKVKQTSFPFIFFGKTPKGYDRELQGGGDAHYKCGFEENVRGLGVRPLY